MGKKKGGKGRGGGASGGGDNAPSTSAPQQQQQRPPPQEEKPPSQPPQQLSFGAVDFPQVEHGRGGGRGGGGGDSRGRGRGRGGGRGAGGGGGESGEFQPSMTSPTEPQPSSTSTRGAWVQGRGRGRGRGGPVGDGSQRPPFQSTDTPPGFPSTPKSPPGVQQQYQQQQYQQQPVQQQQQPVQQQQRPQPPVQQQQQRPQPPFQQQQPPVQQQQRPQPPVQQQQRPQPPVLQQQQQPPVQQQQRPQPPVQQQKVRSPSPPSAPSKLPAQEVTQKMSKMAVSQWKIPERKKNGTRGRKIELELNHFELFFKKQNFIAIHYDVTFKPDKPRRMFRPIMEAFRQKKYPNNYPAFDGRKNLYSARELPFGMEVTDTVKVFNSERQMHQEYEVTVKFASRVDMSQLSQYLSGKGHSYQTPQEALQAVDIVLRNPAALTFVGVGRSFFSEPEQIIDLGEGLELWYGFYQSAILGWKPFLNVDVAHKGFPMGERLLETLCRYQRCSFNDLRNLKRLDSYVQNDFEKYIKGLKVEYQIPNRTDTKRTYKVNKLMKNSVEQRFTLEKDNKKVEMTVGEYFQREKKCSLQFPYLPLVWIGPQNKEFYVPMEMCTIVRGQAVNRKLTPIQTAEMVKNAAKPPDERRKRIANALRRANFNNDKCVQEFGITVSDRFAQVTGRVLEPPNLEYNKQMIKPSKGVWRSGKFLQAVQINNWAIINCDRRTNEGSLQRFASEMITHGRTLGVMIGSQPKIIPFAHIQPNRPNWRKDFGNQLSSLRENKTEIVVVVIPDQGEIYPMVKQTAELSVGILTQCIKSKTMYKMNPATVGNILLKVNSKLNGLNHRLGGRPKLLARPAMIMGADVTHPSPDQTNIPSVAAVSASHDANGFMYNMMWRLQPAKMEIIEDLQNIVVAQLKYFFAKTRQKPETIYFFRDGVSEGMFNQVLSAELTAIRQACRSLNENYKPGITFLVVQKRHHTRFFPMHDRDKEGRLGNVPAGTIVDTQITHKTETDFYLVSHASIQGTARPTKYHLLWDDNNIDEDDLEELTYNLCHLFTRCTRSVSYPAPTYYAHLAAFRARVYLEGQQTTPNLKREMETRVIEVNFHKENPMFFV